MTTYIFFNRGGNSVFKLESDLETALGVVNTARGKIYFRELKDGKLIVTHGIREGEGVSEWLSKEDIRMLQIEGEYEA